MGVEQKNGYHAEKQALLDLHKQVIVDIYAQAFDVQFIDRLESLYDKDRMQDVLGADLRVYLNPAHTSTTSDDPTGQILETQRILKGAPIPVVMRATPSWFKSHPDAPTIQAAFIPTYNDQVLIWIRNGATTLLSGTVTESSSSDKPTIHHQPYPWREAVDIETSADTFGEFVQAVCLAVSEDGWHREHDSLPPKGIVMTHDIEQFLKPDGSIITRWELERKYARLEKRMLTLSAPDAHTNSEIQKRFSALMEATENPETFLRLAEEQFNRLRSDIAWELNQTIRRGKIGAQPFAITVTETEDSWFLHINNVDITPGRLDAIRMPEDDSQIGDLVIQIGKKLIGNEIKFDCYAVADELPDTQLRRKEARALIGATEVIAILAGMERDFDIQQRIERKAPQTKPKIKSDEHRRSHRGRHRW